MGDVNMAVLLAAGFKPIAIWRRTDTGKVQCEGEIPTSTGIYVFAVADVVRYIGAAKNLRDRILSYKRRQDNPKPGRRPIHEKLTKSLERGGEVEVYVLEKDLSAQVTWKGLPVDPILGVGAALIASLNPVWNQRGRTLLLDSDTVPP